MSTPHLFNVSKFAAPDQVPIAKLLGSLRIDLRTVGLEAFADRLVLQDPGALRQALSDLIAALLGARCAFTLLSSIPTIDDRDIEYRISILNILLETTTAALAIAERLPPRIQMAASRKV